MKSKSKGLFHFGRRRQEDSEILHVSGKKSVETSSTPQLHGNGQRRNIVDVVDDSRQMNTHPKKCWIWDQSRENPDEMIQELREADKK